MAEMNELLEEAEAQCSALSDELDTTVASINAMEAKANALAEHAARGGATVHSKLTALAERLEAAEQAIEGARTDAVHDLDALQQQADQVRTDVGSLMGQVHEGLEQLQQQQQQLDEAMNERVQAVGTDFSDLATKVQDAQQAIATQLQEAGQAIAQLGQAVQTAQTSLGEKRDAWSTALDEFENAAKEKTREWIGGLNVVLADQTTAIIDLANRTLVAHNDTMELLKTKFATEAAHQVAASIQPLQDALERLGAEAAARGGELSAKAEDALGRVRSALPILEELKAAFEQSSRLG